ncbi:hypothetical protein FA048_00035 [Pedobacter polaris]|uniref:DUF5977 domain-containing protein n=1 Tax=Pedobacter polaris TaxID=2571273 RepID=A0A4U1CTD7_9SPHI|nr:DUF5977 domain-containing protein [Pedobacter polaris]TKC12043.1 hypothetical protein FA048_00035 [Pedobacter polaris]
MRKPLLLLLVLFGLYQGVHAQSPMIRTDLIPASPTAGSIAKAGEVPLNLSSGLPSLSIPICTVQGNELSLPISLNYSYDGFRPAQPSGWAGLGWTLEAGGVITRSIRDKVDGTMGSGNYNGTTVQTTLYSPNTPSQDFLKWAPVMYDLEPDEFSFNFAGYSGKFIIHNGKIHVYPSQKLKVWGGISGFTITTENGNRYHFGQVETTNPKGSPGAPYNLPSSYNSAYYLTMVENAAGTEKIILTYDSEGKISNNGSATQSFRRDLSMVYGGGTPSPISVSYPTYVNPVRLSSIVSEKVSVSFIPGADRIDLNQSAGGYAKELAQIDVSGKAGLVRRFKLGHSYGGSGYYSSNSYLMLDYIKECPVTLLETPLLTDTLTHTFEYEGVSGVSHIYAAVDHFGYSLGGSDFGDMMIPSHLHPTGVNRDPSLSGTMQGAMKKVTYPSGGSTSFSYQLNMTPDGMGYEKDHHSVGETIIRPSGGLSTLNGNYMSFTINEGQTVNFIFSRTPYNEQWDGNTKDVENEFEVSNSSGLVFGAKISKEADNAGLTASTYLSPGSYHMQVKADWREAMVSASMSYYTVSNRPIEGTPSGGLRVASMTTTPQAGPALYREFNYTTPLGFSTGVAPVSGYHQYPFDEITVVPSDAPVYKNYMVYTSYVAEAPVLSLPHYYTSVLERQVAGTDTLFTRHEFTAFGYAGMGTVPSRVTQYRRNGSGVLIPATSKSFEYVQVQDTMFRKMKAFQVMQVNNSGGWWSGPTETWDYTDEFVALGWKYLRSTREVSYEGSDSLVTVTSNSYDANRNLNHVSTAGSRGEVMVSRMKYPESYDGDLAFMTTNNIVSPVIEQQSWNKVGSDSLLVSGSLTEYSAANFKPIKRYMLDAKGITALNNESRTGTLYNNLMSDTRYEERANYTYNPTGRLVSQQLVGGTPVSYQWGYASFLPYGYTSLGQQNYPVAEVKNALPSEFYMENFEEHGSATTGTANTGDKCYSGDFYLNWAIPNSRSYVVTFFYLSAGKWHYKRQAYTGAVTLSDGDAIDDVAVYPADAQLGSYTYFDGIGSRSAIDAKGLKMDYEYDELNRLINIRDQNGDIVKNYRYNQGTANAYYYNAAITAKFTKNDCASGLLGSPVSYTVPANTYGSATSQAAADAMATATLTANGQAYANANGTCATGVVVSFVNATFYPFQGAITQLQVKDASGNVLYTFNEAQVIAGFTIPQGTYTLSFTIIALTPGYSWGTCYVSSTAGYQEFYTNGTTNYNLTGVALTASTALIYLDSYIY